MDLIWFGIIDRNGENINIAMRGLNKKKGLESKIEKKNRP